MQTTLEKQVTETEKQVDKLRRPKNKRPVVIKDWRRSVGIMEDSPIAREGDALGEAYRRSQTRP